MVKYREHPAGMKWLFLHNPESLDDDGGSNQCPPS